MNLAIDILIFLSGLILGNWLAIGRDRRKEFNEIADAVYLALVKEAKSINSSGAVVDGPDDSKLVDLKRKMPFYNKNRYNKAVENYKKQTSAKNWKQDRSGQPFYTEPEKVIISINELIKYTNRKQYI